MPDPARRHASWVGISREKRPARTPEELAALLDAASEFSQSYSFDIIVVYAMTVLCDSGSLFV